MLAYGLVPAYLVRKAKSKPTSIPVFHKSLFPVEGSAIFMLTLLDLFQFLALLIIFLPWILILDSQRLSLSHQSLQLCVLRLCSVSTLRMGFSGLEFHQSLLQIVKHKALCLLHGISHTKTTLFHPQSNVMVERSPHSLESLLRSKLVGSGWIHHLPLVLLGFRSAPKDDQACSSAEGVYGSLLILPGIFKSGVSSVLLSFSAPTNHHVISSKVMVPKVPSTRERSWQAPLDCSLHSAAPPLVRFSSHLSPPSSQPSLPSSHILRRNPPRGA